MSASRWKRLELPELEQLELTLLAEHPPHTSLSRETMLTTDDPCEQTTYQCLLGYRRRRLVND